MDRDIDVTMRHRDGRIRRFFPRSTPGEAGLSCDLGPILDISQGGLRVLTPKSFDGGRRIRIHSSVGSMEIDVAIAWAKKLGFRRWMLGLQFISVAPAEAHQIAQIMKAHAPDLHEAA